MKPVMGFLYYCYGPHYNNGSSTYRGALCSKSVVMLSIAYRARYCLIIIIILSIQNIKFRWSLTPPDQVIASQIKKCFEWYFLYKSTFSMLFFTVLMCGHAKYGVQCALYCSIIIIDGHRHFPRVGSKTLRHGGKTMPLTQKPSLE